MNEKTFVLNNLEFKSNDLQANSLSLNKDLQFKLSRNDALLNKLENEHMSQMNLIKDLQMQLQDQNRSVMMRMTDMESRVMSKPYLYLKKKHLIHVFILLIDP